MKNSYRKFISAFSAVILGLLIAFPAVVLADASINMTTSNSSVDIAGDIEIEVTISADQQIGTYYVELEYDSSRMRYVGGAENEQDGILTLTGTGMENTVEYDLEFTGATGGEAGMIVRTALVNDSAGNAMASTNSGMLQITVNGQSDNTASFSQKLEEEMELQESDLPISGSIHDPDGNTYYVIDLTRTTPDVLTFDFDTVEETFEGQTVTFATDKDGVLMILPLMDSNDNVSLYAVNGDMFYPMAEHTTPQNATYYYVPLDACMSVPQKLASDTEMWDYVVYGISKDGKGGFYLMDAKGNLDYYTVLNGTSLTPTGWMANIFSGTAIPWERYLIIAAIVIIGVIILCIILHYVLRGHKKRKVRLAAESQYDFYLDTPVSVDEDLEDIDVIRRKEDIVRDIEGESIESEVPEAETPEADEPEEEDEDGFSLDDIVLTEEDVPGGVPERKDSGAGTNSISSTESEMAPDAMESTIRINKAKITEKLEENSIVPDKNSESQD